jgi:hypothetical protein
MAIELNLNDLQFVLKQIKIGEAHANGAALTEIRLNPLTGDVLTDGTLYNDDGVFIGGPGFPLVDGDGAPIIYPLAIPDSKTPFGIRTVDGSFNNLMEGREFWGAANQPMPRFFDPNYTTGQGSIDLNGDAPGGVMTGGNYANPTSVVDTQPRIISNLVADMSVNNPAALYAALVFAESAGLPGRYGRLQSG